MFSILSESMNEFISLPLQDSGYERTFVLHRGESRYRTSAAFSSQRHTVASSALVDVAVITKAVGAGETKTVPFDR